MKIHPLIATALLVSTLQGEQAPSDPYRKSSAATAPAAEDAHVNLSICHEAFSVPLAMAAKIQRERISDPELYNRLIAGLENKTVRQESFNMLRCKTEQKATLESMSEQIYPTEFQPAEIPKAVGVAISPSERKSLPTPAVDGKKTDDDFSAVISSNANPVAFETRNCGITLEVEPNLAEDGQTAVVRIVPDYVVSAGRITWGHSMNEVEMPIFESQRLNTAVNLRVKQPCLLGTLNRPPLSTVDPQAAGRVWFSFVTLRTPKA